VLKMLLPFWPICMRMKALANAHTLCSCSACLPTSAEKGVKELTEGEAVKLFYSSLLSWQMQLEGDYHADIHIRDRIVLAFSEYSPRLKELFQSKRPRTSHQALQKIIKRCSYELRYDLLPSRDTDVLRPDIVANYIQNRFKERYNGAASGKKRTSKLARGPKRGCWVCQKRDHYSHERHTPEEVAAAKKFGRETRIPGAGSLGW
jgi:hypothetical protein